MTAAIPLKNLCHPQRSRPKPGRALNRDAQGPPISTKSPVKPERATGPVVIMRAIQR